MPEYDFGVFINTPEVWKYAQDHTTNVREAQGNDMIMMMMTMTDGLVQLSSAYRLAIINLPILEQLADDELAVLIFT